MWLGRAAALDLPGALNMMYTHMFLHCVEAFAVKFGVTESPLAGAAVAAWQRKSARLQACIAVFIVIAFGLLLG